MTKQEENKGYLLGWDPLTEEYYITGPNDYSCFFGGLKRGNNALITLRVLVEDTEGD